MTKHSDSGESQTSNPPIPSVTHYEMSHFPTLEDSDSTYIVIGMFIIVLFSCPIAKVCIKASVDGQVLMPKESQVPLIFQIITYYWVIYLHNKLIQ